MCGARACVRVRARVVVSSARASAARHISPDDTTLSLLLSVSLSLPFSLPLRPSLTGASFVEYLDCCARGTRWPSRCVADDSELPGLLRLVDTYVLQARCHRTVSVWPHALGRLLGPVCASWTDYLVGFASRAC